MLRTSLPPTRRRPHRQQGVALFVVIVFVMLSMLLALWASRTSLFNEMLVGNDADYQRALESAQALLQDAELDIRGESPDGSRCALPGKPLCRDNIPTADKIPLSAGEATQLLAKLDTEPTKCHSGLCVKRLGRQDFWNTITSTPINPGEVTLQKMTEITLGAPPTVGARYGQYTGAKQGDSSNPANPILQWDTTTPGTQGGWYWIEVLRYQESSPDLIDPAGTANSNLLSLNLQPNVVYRITALAYGRKPGTVAILQQTYARQVTKD